MTADPPKRLPRALAVLRDGIDRGLHLGGQLYVSRDGERLADLAFGDVRPGEPMTTEHLMLWLSSGKPLTAVALAKLWEEGRLGLDDPVVRHLPEFAAHGKEAITLRHLLTHTGGIRMLDVGWPDDSWDEILARICAHRPEPRWVPGLRAGYHATSSWFVLGEVIQRVSGRPFPSFLRQEVLEPLGMLDSWVGMPADRYREYGARIAPVYDTEKSPAEAHGWDSEPRVTRPSPGGNAYGPLRDLGRFYERLLAAGRGEPDSLLLPQTVAALTARHRVGLRDRTFGFKMDWGLGVIVNSAHYGAPDVPYGFGRHASPQTWGHAGYRSSIGFADPEHGLAVALAVNGLPSETDHQARFAELTEALYEDLGLARRKSE